MGIVIKNFKNNRWFFITIFLTIISGVFFIAWVFNSTNIELRENLLEKAELVAHAVNLDHIKALAGNETDLT
ncbi:MAG TPA: hypothetical protein PLT70_10820, partial [bacterium]|nr:hypothetical protein [bacterium]